MDEQAGTEEAVPLQDDLSRLLLRVGRDQDDSAFETLFRHYGPRIRAFMRKRCGDATQAEELMQETFANVWRRAGSFDPARGTVSAWIYTVARNTSVDVFRRRNRPEFDPQDPALLPEAAEQADTVMEMRQSAERLRLAMRDLPGEQSEVLKLSFFEELSHSVIAERLGIPLGTVKSRIRMAFSRLRDSLGENP